MKIKLKRPFSYANGPRETITLAPGVHTVDKRVAELALRWGKATLVAEKKAPENKIVKPAENKAGVARKAKPRRSTRAKSKS